MSNKRTIGKEPHHKPGKEEARKREALGKGLANKQLHGAATLELAQEYKKNKRWKEAALAFEKAGRMKDAERCAIDFAWEVPRAYLLKFLKHAGSGSVSEREIRDFKAYIKNNGVEQVFGITIPDNARRTKWLKKHAELCSEVLQCMEAQLALKKQDERDARNDYRPITGCFSPVVKEGKCF